MSFTKCFTKEEAESNEPPKTSSRDTDCQVSDLKVDGNTVSWKISCAKQGVTGEGSATYSGDSYSGQSKVHMRGQEVSSKFTGRYLGECDK